MVDSKEMMITVFVMWFMNLSRGYVSKITSIKFLSRLPTRLINSLLVTVVLAHAS